MYRRLLMLGLLFLPVVSAAQELPPQDRGLQEWTPLGSRSDERDRVHSLLRPSGERISLIRSPSSLLSAPSGWTGVRPLAPRLAVAWNSGLPFSMNDGPLWSGRGLNLDLLAGLHARYGAVELILAPQLLYSQNTDVQVLPPESQERRPYSTPWYIGRSSADIPARFGNQSLLVLDPGQSTLSVRFGSAAAGVSTENQWWGPGIRNALVMSDNAAGIPHGFLRTSRPLTSRWGTFEGRWMAGALTESLHFDTIAANDLRSITALAMTFSPAAEPGVTLGLARAVYARAADVSDVLRNGPMVLTHWGGAVSDTLAEESRTAEQLLSLFARWRFPADGLEAYVEWAHAELPGSLTDWIAAPYASQGYTLGMQWARKVSAVSGLVRMHAEVTYLEQTSDSDPATVRSFYTSPFVEHGYTQRGQVIGAAIGPGASSQWVAVDYIARSWELGMFGGRVRWANDAYYSRPTGFAFWSHDVTLFGGVRGGLETTRAELALEISYGNRLNYMFQNYRLGFGPETRDDHRNLNLQLSIQPIAR